MKKTFILLLLTLILTGCTRIDNKEEYKDITNIIVNSSNNLVNTATKGYKYYLPKGVSVIQNMDFNQKFRITDNDVYLYADTISYYYKKNLSYNKDDYNYYFSNINSKDKVGYIGINKEGESYFVKIVYNYSTMEFYTTKDKLSALIGYSTIILDSIVYNDILIKEMLENNDVSTNEKIYEIQKPDDSESKFSDYLQEYVSDEEKVDVLPDE